MGARGRDAGGGNGKIASMPKQRRRLKVHKCSVCCAETSFPHGKHDERHQLRVCKSCYTKLKA